MAGFTILVTILDYVVPAGGAKKYGASKWGVVGAMTGMLIGIFMFPPWGMIMGAFMGAFAGELLARKEARKALQAGFGVFVGIMVGTGLKLALSGTILFFYLKEIF